VARLETPRNEQHNPRNRVRKHLGLRKGSIKRPSILVPSQIHDSKEWGCDFLGPWLAGVATDLAGYIDCTWQWNAVFLPNSFLREQKTHAVLFSSQSDMIVKQAPACNFAGVSCNLPN